MMQGKRNLWVVLAVVGSSLGGCVAESKYRDLEVAWRRSQEQVAELQARAAELQQQIEELRGGQGDAAARVAELREEREQLMADLEKLRQQYVTLANRPAPALLPAAVDEALRDFASQHGDLVSYDPQRGMVKFRSDLTFALGSVQVTDSARRTLSELAGLLTDPELSKYEVRVVGHTDSVRIGREQTRERHPTNWHLSAHRAIAVRDVLDEAGVPAVRTTISGASMYRPVVANSPSGAERNRRVEIYLVAMPSVNESFIAGGVPDEAAGEIGEAASASSRSGEIPLK